MKGQQLWDGLYGLGSSAAAELEPFSTSACRRSSPPPITKIVNIVPFHTDASGVVNSGYHFGGHHSREYSGIYTGVPFLWKLPYAIYERMHREGSGWLAWLTGYLGVLVSGTRVKGLGHGYDERSLRRTCLWKRCCSYI